MLPSPADFAETEYCQDEVIKSKIAHVTNSDSFVLYGCNVANLSPVSDARFGVCVSLKTCVALGVGSLMLLPRTWRIPR